MALDTFNPYLFVSAGEQSNKYLTPTITNGIAQFQAQRAQSLTGLTVRIEGVQEGTGDPSPENIRPISGRTGMTVTRTGKNLLDVAGRSFGPASPTTIYAEQCAATKDGNTIIATVTGAWSKVRFGLDTAQLKVGQKYTASALFKNPSGGRIGVSFYDGSWHDTPITTIADGKLSETFQYNGQSTLQIGYLINNTSAGTGYTVTLSEIQLEAGETVTQYTPYVTTTTYPVSWQTEAGTVYGGTLDVVSGVLTVDHILLSVPYWTKSDMSTGRTRFSSSYYKQTIKPAAASSTVADVICSCFITTSANNGYTGAVEDSIVVDTSGMILCYPNRNGTIAALTAGDFKTYMDSQQIIAALATPQTYRLTGAEVRTIPGFNQIYSDAGPVIDIKF